MLEPLGNSKGEVDSMGRECDVRACGLEEAGRGGEEDEERGEWVSDVEVACSCPFARRLSCTAIKAKRDGGCEQKEGE